MTNLVLASFLCVASWERYSDHGKIAANGKPFDASAMTCAHRKLPLGTVVRVTDIANSNSVVVTVTDRTSKHYSHRIDLSPAAFKKLNSLELGLCKVKVEVISHIRPPQPPQSPSAPVSASHRRTASPAVPRKRIASSGLVFCMT